MERTVKFMSGSYAVIDGVARRISVKRVWCDKDGMVYVLETPDGKPLGEFRETAIYPTLEDFEKEGCVRMLTGELESRFKLDEQGRVLTWKMENGEPSPLWMDDLVMEVGSRCEAVLPDGYYPTREECLRHSTWVELRDDGTRVEHKGILEKIKLTKEQQEYVDNVLRPAMKGAIEKGIGLITDWNEFMYAYNEQELDDKYEWNSSPDDNIHWAEMSEMTPVCGGFGVVSEECVLIDK